MFGFHVVNLSALLAEDRDRGNMPPDLLIGTILNALAVDKQLPTVIVLEVAHLPHQSVLLCLQWKDSLRLLSLAILGWFLLQHFNLKVNSHRLVLAWESFSVMATKRVVIASVCLLGLPIGLPIPVQVWFALSCISRRKASSVVFKSRLMDKIISRLLSL